MFNMYREVTVHRIDSAIRFFVNLVLLFLLFSNADALFINRPNDSFGWVNCLLSKSNPK